MIPAPSPEAIRALSPAQVARIARTQQVFENTGAYYASRIYTSHAYDDPEVQEYLEAQRGPLSEAVAAVAPVKAEAASHRIGEMFALLNLTSAALSYLVVRRAQDLPDWCVQACSQAWESGFQDWDLPDAGRSETASSPVAMGHPYPMTTERTSRDH